MIGRRSLHNWRYPVWVWWQANLVGERLTWLYNHSTPVLLIVIIVVLLMRHI